MTDARVALVTGGNRGLGLEIVRQLAQKGLKTVLASRDAVKGRTAAEQLAGAGVQTAIVALDVNDQASIDTAVAEIVRLNGRLDVLVNNAGISLDGSRATVAGVLEVSPDIARQTYETNVLGPMRLIQAVAPHMRAQRYGRIVNVSSRMGQLSGMGARSPGYRMSKAAVNALTLVAAAELGSDRIKVNAMHPGWVRTDMGGSSAPVSVQDGADTAVWLATLPDDGPTGQFFEKRKAIAW
jgi:NAD(P)-dependent dehydrogenase (short-subunit alcohol dehydrogenase family)